MHSVVVVDDEKWVLRGILGTFRWEEYGYQVVFSTTKAREAFSYILRQPPDVAFVDIRMPELSGTELLAGLREAGIATDVVILSGVQDYTLLRTSIQYAAFDYCLKPITQEMADDILGRLKAYHAKTKPAASALYADQDASPKVLLRNKEFFLKIGTSTEGGDPFGQLLQYIHEHISEPLRLGSLAERFYISPNHVSYLFRMRLHTTYSDYVNLLRLNKAKQLLRRTGMSIDEIAKACGYSDIQYFCHVFRKKLACTPLQYKRAGGGAG